MPVAVITQPSERRELKSCPGGYVVIKRMTYGQKLTRREMTRMTVSAQRGSKKDVQAEIDAMQRKVSLWEFANLIEDHNLDDENGRKLNFQNSMDVDKLAGPIGEEIDTLISELNNFEDDAADEKSELGN